MVLNPQKPPDKRWLSVMLITIDPTLDIKGIISME